MWTLFGFQGCYALSPRLRRWGAVVLISTLATQAWALEHSHKASPGTELVTSLRSGGYVLVMRHASSPRRPPDFTQANADNPEHERQLDLSGRLSATAMGAALRELQIPVGSILASPAYRALETVRYAQFGSANTYPQLEDFGADGSMDPLDPTDQRIAWLRAQTLVRPASGTNTIIVTHLANIRAAFPQNAEDLADGEALIFQPDGRGSSPMIRRIRIEDWQKLTAPH